jgi:hypothetical protein
MVHRVVLMGDGQVCGMTARTQKDGGRPDVFVIQILTPTTKVNESGVKPRGHQKICHLQKNKNKITSHIHVTSKNLSQSCHHRQIHITIKRLGLRALPSCGEEKKAPMVAMTA